MGWVCKYCSTNNEDRDAQCIVCDKPKASSTICTLTAKRIRDLNLRGDVIIPLEFNVIGEDAFSNRTDITSVTLHSDVRKIMKNAFYGCKNLQRVIARGELEYIGSKAFYDCKKLSSSNRPRAQKVSDDAYAVAPEPVVSSRPSVSIRTPTTSSTTHRTIYTSTSSSSSSTGMKVIAWTILAVFALALIVPLFIAVASNYEPYWWSWLIGIGGGLVVLFLVWVISIMFEDSFESCSVATVLFWILSIVNLILLFSFKEDYGTISSLFNLLFALGILVATISAFSNRKPVCATFAILMLVANVIMLFASPAII